MNKMTTANIAAFLRKLADMIESGDSTEGSFAYSLDFQDDDPNVRLIEARVRTGNLEGQGGVVIL